MKQRRYVLWAMLCLVALAPSLMAQTPPTPMDLAATVSMSPVPSVNLEWKLTTLPPMPSGLLFRVYRSADDSSHFALRDVVIGKSFRDFDVATGHTYFYFVTSAFMHDTTAMESAHSDTASAMVVPVPPKPHGTIAGTVTDSVTGKPLAGVRILFFRVSSDPDWVPQVWTDTAGHYSASLDTGKYIVNAQPWAILLPMTFPPMMVNMMTVWPVFPRYLPEWFDDAKTAAEATPIQVSDSSQFTADFDLMRFVPPTFVKVQGTVSDTAGHPLKGALVVIARSMQEMMAATAMSGEPADLDDGHIDVDGLGHLRGIRWWGRTDSSGNFSASVLSGQSYVALAWKSGFLPQWFDHKSSPQDADVIALTGDTTGINFSLSPKPVQNNSISGTVMDSSGTRVPSRIVLIRLSAPPFSSVVRSGFTDSLGAYTLTSVDSGKYLVLAIPYSTFAPAFYKAGAFGVINWRHADTVVIAGNVTGIDIGVVPIHFKGFAHLIGRVRFGSQGLAGVNVFALDPAGEIVGFALTGSSGSFAMDGVAAGSITLVADAPSYNSAQSSMTIASNASSVSSSDLVLTTSGTTGVSNQPAAPQAFTLSQNYPNPFNPSTRISFSLPVQSNVTLKVYNILGQEIATLENGSMSAGTYAAVWNGKDNLGRSVASGVYFYRLSASSVSGNFTSLKKMLLLK